MANPRIARILPLALSLLLVPTPANACESGVVGGILLGALVLTLVIIPSLVAVRASGGKDLRPQRGTFLRGWLYGLVMTLLGMYLLMDSDGGALLDGGLPSALAILFVPFLTGGACASAAKNKSLKTRP